MQLKGAIGAALVGEDDVAGCDQWLICFRVAQTGFAVQQCFAEAENVLAGFGVALAGPVDCRFYGQLFAVRTFHVCESHDAVGEQCG